MILILPLTCYSEFWYLKGEFGKNLSSVSVNRNKLVTLENTAVCHSLVII